MRGYPGFDMARFQDMLVTYFYPMNHSFLNRETNCWGHYWANWGCRRNPVTSGHVLPGGGHLRVNSDRSPVC